MKKSQAFIARGSASLQATVPILSRILEGSKHHGAILAHDLILKELFLGLM